MYTNMLNNPEIESYKISIRLPITGSAPTPYEIHKRWKELFSYEIIEGYGLSECSPVVTAHRSEGVKKIGSIGPALPMIEVKIVDEDDNEVLIGEIGELIVKGPSNMIGYWNKPEETAKIIKNGWVYTGDIGYQDQDGYFFIVDRKKDY